jgi:hypothetical protein
LLLCDRAPKREEIKTRQTGFKAKVKAKAKAKTKTKVKVEAKAQLAVARIQSKLLMEKSIQVADGEEYPSHRWRRAFKSPMEEEYPNC